MVHVNQSHFNIVCVSQSINFAINIDLGHNYIQLMQFFHDNCAELNSFHFGEALAVPRIRLIVLSCHTFVSLPLSLHLNKMCTGLILRFGTYPNAFHMQTWHTAVLIFFLFRAHFDGCCDGVS